MPARGDLARRLRMSDERGAFAILYGVLVLMLSMLAALVVDIGMLRMDRGLERAAADAAAAAGAGDLTQLTNSRSKACRTAFEYALLNLGESKTGATYPPCNSLPVTCSASTPTAQVTGTSGRFTITIASPVGDGSAFMEPDIEPGSVTQPIDAAIDGTNCERLAVQVDASRSFLLGAVEGFSGASTGVHAVARAQLTGTTTIDLLVGLAALDSSACHAIRITGTGGLAVRRSSGAGDSLPGVIAVDSDATGGSGANDCNTGFHRAIEISETSGNHVRAYPSATGAIGQIRSYALAGPQPSRAYESSMTSGCNPASPDARLCPVPMSVSEPLTRQPWDDAYDAEVTQVDNQLGGSGLPTGYQQLPDPALTPTEQAQFCGSVAGQTELFFPLGDYVVTCPQWTVTANVGFEDGTTVVLDGDLYIDDTGCVAMGVADASERNLACAGSPPAAGTDSRLYVRGSGDITREPNGGLVLVDTFVRSDGKFDMQPGGNGDLRWTAPTGGNLAGLAYWGLMSPSSTDDAVDGDDDFSGFTHRIAGSRSDTQLTGVFFAPNGLLQLNLWGTGTDTWQAQLAAGRITSKGDVDLDLEPDTAWGLEVPLVGTNLIR